MQQEDPLEINRAGWDTVAPLFCPGTALPIYGPLAPTEDDLGLLGDIAGQRQLELGCGSGHSLAYVAEHGAAELWGLDLSQAQIDLTTTTLEERGRMARLFRSPMEINPGLPEGYFDVVISIYAVGWTTDLARTFELVAFYLKPGGRFVFSWEHPVYSCLHYEARNFVLSRSYSEEGPVLHHSWSGVPVVMQRRKLSTFVNGLIDAGLAIERLVEGDLDVSRARDTDQVPDKWYSVPRARLVPTTFIVKACKPAAAS